MAKKKKKLCEVFHLFSLKKYIYAKKREKEKVATPPMLSGWHHENEMNRDMGTKYSFPDFKEKQKPASTKHRLLKELIINYGTVLRKTLPWLDEMGLFY